MLFNVFIICVLFCFVIWFYFVKHQESDKQYSNLHNEYMNLCNENQKLKTRLKDLQSYKNDVSKTFKILDNELLLINDRLQNRESNLNTPQPNPISVLTPELLTSLFNNMNQEFTDYSPSFVEGGQNPLDNTNFENQTPIEELNNNSDLDNEHNKVTIEQEQNNTVDKNEDACLNLGSLEYPNFLQADLPSVEGGRNPLRNPLSLNKEDYSQYLIDN